MHSAWVGILILATVGLVAAAGVGAMLYLATMPGTILLMTWTRSKHFGRTRWVVGHLLSVCAVCYLALAWVGVAVTFARGWTYGSSGIGKWAVWCLAFVVATLPSSAMLKGSKANRRRFEGQEFTEMALAWGWIAAPVGFFLFSVVPATMGYGWDWVERIGVLRHLSSTS
jgi:hypothetical protein